MTQSEIAERLGNISNWFCDATASEYPECIESLFQVLADDQEFADEVREALDLTLDGALPDEEVMMRVRNDFNRRVRTIDDAKECLTGIRVGLFGPRT